LDGTDEAKWEGTDDNVVEGDSDRASLCMLLEIELGTLLVKVVGETDGVVGS
jgi:hypothetical protein